VPKQGSSYSTKVLPNRAHPETKESINSKLDSASIKLIKELINKKQRETILWSVSASLFVMNLAHLAGIGGSLYRDHLANLRREEAKISKHKSYIFALETDQESG